MRYGWLLMLLCAGVLQGSNLQTLIAHAQKNNGQIRAKALGVVAKQKSLDAAESALWPTVDVGGSASKYTPSYVVAPGEELTGFAKIEWALYDGGGKRATRRAKHFEKEAALFEKQAFEKSVTLQIVQHYFGIKSLEASLQALKERSRELQAQMDRVKKFIQTGLSTQEEAEKLRAAYEENRYLIENTALSLETSKAQLQLLTGLPVGALGRSYFKEPKHLHLKWFDAIKTLEANAKAVGENAKAMAAGNKPQVALSDTYFRSHFGDTPPMPALPGIESDGFLVDHQNELKLSVQMRLFDKGRIAKESEALKYRRLALMSELEHAKKEQKMHFRLAQRSLETTRAKIHSAKSALRAANTTYVNIKKKFEAGLVDDIAYLDALTQKTLAQARYKETVYDYEVKKSVYYYYAGRDPKEFIR